MPWWGFLLAHGHHKDVGFPAHLSEVSRARVAYRHGGVLGQEQQNADGEKCNDQFHRPSIISAENGARIKRLAFLREYRPGNRRRLKSGGGG